MAKTTTNKPCKFDHNGECLICDCWISDCLYDKLVEDRCESPQEVEELKELFKEYLDESENP